MKVKPNILPPTLRIKKRYVVFQVYSEKKISFEDVVNAIWGCFLNFAGELNLALSRIKIMKDLWDEQKQVGVIRCAHTAVELIRSVLILIDRIGDSKVVFRVLGVSGTLNSAKRKFINQKTLEEF
ncbi:MAG TPA: ribonuclease P protein component 2 [Nanoarchaeota archaeon]|nr:ribonuclease P protein component 2 [Nanoarchaeota archaeon]